MVEWWSDGKPNTPTLQHSVGFFESGAFPVLKFREPADWRIGRHQATVEHTSLESFDHKRSLLCATRSSPPGSPINHSAFKQGLKSQPA